MSYLNVEKDNTSLKGGVADSRSQMTVGEILSLAADDIALVEEGFKRDLASNVFLISKIGEYILSSGGKRFRPLILILSSRMCGYSGNSHIPLAEVLEFLHTATLLHDDVVDSGDMRRGKASANTLWGNGASVLVGDYLLAKAFNLAVGEGNLRILDILSATTTRMAEGEVLQLLKHSDPEVTEAEYLEVIKYKTAVLFSAAARVGGVLSGVSEEQEEALESYGHNIGIAFQLTDDSLDYTSSDETLGKAIGNDLREGKVTLPLLKAFSECTEAEGELIVKAIEAEDSDAIDEGVQSEIFEIINRYEGIEYTTERARVHIEEAKAALAIFPDTVERAALTSLADFILTRPS